MVDISHALDTTSGADLIPEKLDPILVELADKATPLRKLIKRIPWDTNAYEYNKRSALLPAEFYSESDAFSADTSTYGREVVAIKMLRAEGSVSNMLIKASKQYIDSLQAEIESATKSLAQKEEQALITGDASVTPKEFSGLNKLITQSVDAAHAAISLAKIDEAIDKIKAGNGKADLILVADRDLSKLNQIIFALGQNIWADRVTVAVGVELGTYRGIPVVGSAYVPTNLAPSGYTDESYAFVLDRSQVVAPVMQEVTYEEVPETTDAKSFRVKEWMALAVKAPLMECKIVNIAKPS